MVSLQLVERIRDGVMLKLCVADDSPEEKETVYDIYRFKRTKTVYTVGL